MDGRGWFHYKSPGFTAFTDEWTCGRMQTFILSFSFGGWIGGQDPSLPLTESLLLGKERIESLELSLNRSFELLFGFHITSKSGNS